MKNSPSHTPASPPEDGLAIHAVGLTRIYSRGPAEVAGIRDADLSVPKGELVLIKGESGSGKSTLLALFGGLDQPTGGSLRVAGLDLVRATSRELTHFRRKKVGMVFQTFNLLPTLTALENVCLPGLLAGGVPSRVRKDAAELLAWLNLGDRFGHFPSQLSGGEMQRTAIARALINGPEIILADEPTGNLDSQNGEIVVDLLAELNRKQARTVIIATHSVLADRCATMNILLKDGIIAGRGASHV